MHPILRRTAALWLPVAVASTIMAGLIYVSVQQNYRQSANDPQLQVARDAAALLSTGAAPKDVASGPQVDIASSLSPFTIVYDADGKVLASTGVLDGSAPTPPPGVLQAATDSGSDTLTWEPQDGVRSAIDVVRWSGASDSGTVLAGRSLQEVEHRVDELTLMVGAAWFAAMMAAAAAAVVGAFLWGRDPSRSSH